MFCSQSDHRTKRRRTSLQKEQLHLREQFDPVSLVTATTRPKGTTKSSFRLLKNLLQSFLFSTTGIRTCLQQMSIFLQLGDLNQGKYKTHQMTLTNWLQIFSKTLVWINSVYTLILLQFFCLNSIYLFYSYIFYYLFEVVLCRAKSWNWWALWILSNTGYFMIL